MTSHLTIVEIDSGNYSTLEIGLDEFHGWVWIDEQE